MKCPRQTNRVYRKYKGGWRDQREGRIEDNYSTTAGLLSGCIETRGGGYTTLCADSDLIVTQNCDYADSDFILIQNCQYADDNVIVDFKMVTYCVFWISP